MPYIVAQVSNLQNSVLHRIQNCNSPYFNKALADWKSAIQQVGNLRYFGGCASKLV
jgi:hypothetical protein